MTMHSPINSTSLSVRGSLEESILDIADRIIHMEDGRLMANRKPLEVEQQGRTS
ncbi:MAG: hypothetical protein WCA07_02455 [Gloeobacterales cyanobacterium]